MFAILAGNHALVSHKDSYHIHSDFFSASLVSVTFLILLETLLILLLELAFAYVRRRSAPELQLLLTLAQMDRVQVCPNGFACP